MSVLKSFVIGSSYPVFIHFFVKVSQLINANPLYVNYTYSTYTFVAPLYFGLMNMFSLFLKDIFNLSQRSRYLLISLISALFVISLAKYFNTYNYTQKQWNKYMVMILINHTLTYMITIRLLEALI